MDNFSLQFKKQEQRIEIIVQGEQLIFSSLSNSVKGIFSLTHADNILSILE